MKKFLSFVILTGLCSTIISPVFALMAPAQDKASPSNIVPSSERAFAPESPIVRNSPEIEYPK